MKIGSYIAGIVTVILLACSLIKFLLHCRETTPAIASTWFLLFFAVVAAVAGAIFFKKSTRNFIRNSEGFRLMMNYCYSCGFSLNKNMTIEVCPKCNAKLNLIEVIDE
ncbi:hypothetical protein KJA13_03125 [Patescibacteria group bacterium]|nr:hypothetical protein [Patescibacteria group bacterium]